MIQELIEEGVSTGANAVEMMIYKPFVNGNTIVNNVPHVLQLTQANGIYKEANEPYLSADILLELSKIIEFMQRNRIAEIDFNEFKVKNQSISNNKVHSFHIKSINNKNENPGLSDKEWADYALSQWIKPYHTIQLKARTLGNTGDILGKQALEWLALFHNTLDALPNLHKDLIQKKYLEIDRDGKNNLDMFVYDDLQISKNVFYRKKAEALSKLGKILSRHNVNIKDLL